MDIADQAVHIGCGGAIIETAEAALGVYSGLVCVQYGALLVWFRKLALPKFAAR